MKNMFEINGAVTIVFLKRKDGTILETIIDTATLEKLSGINCTWYAKKDYTSTNGDKYYVCGHMPNSNKFIMLHRFLFDNPEGLVIDHINGNTLDNRISENLRIVSHAQNNQNIQVKNFKNSSGIRGVLWNKRRKKWVARITVNKKYVYHGSFDNLDDAKLAIEEARSKYMPYSLEAYRKVSQS